MSDAPPVAAGGGRRGLVALGVAVLVAAAVIAIFAGRGRIAPELTPTLEHLAALGGHDADACLSCHHPEGPAVARPAGHTPRKDCWDCHAAKGQGGG